MNKTTQKTMFSSATGNWATPQDFFDKLSWRFGPFDLDPCASTHNTKCANFFTKAENGLEKDWEGFTCFVNPPYGRGIDKWIEKGYNEAMKNWNKGSDAHSGPNRYQVLAQVCNEGIRDSLCERSPKVW